MNLVEAIADIGRESDSFNNDRPYNGQPWTHLGERGKYKISNLTMRDVVDCYYKAIHCCQPKTVKCVSDVYKCDWESIDPVALAQNLVCEMEKAIGIFPNVPELASTDIMQDIPMRSLEEALQDA